ncbi:hypothetical protein RB195_014292 [Necator americanus]|uniref:Uncharacterized protein n=1 Tax=Necator americanus TaxID=51031 RepID=A0ABR1DZN6_NECAM
MPDILVVVVGTLDEAQPQEQDGFRQEISCLDHIQTVSKVKERNALHTCRRGVMESLYRAMSSQLIETTLIVKSLVWATVKEFC